MFTRDLIYIQELDYVLGLCCYLRVMLIYVVLCRTSYFFYLKCQLSTPS